ncbi:MAG: hypothetical protein MJ252_13715 [archaeon]|nr:hypothetical protein [archaeon]
MKTEIVCNKLGSISNYICIFVFLVSLIIFRFIINKNKKESSEDRDEKSKNMEEYFNKHLKENEDFFFGESQ